MLVDKDRPEILAIPLLDLGNASISSLAICSFSVELIGVLDLVVVSQS